MVFDAIVVGAGPAGSMTGYHLAKAGLRVAILDAKNFPRIKACGGGLQSRAAASLPFDISPVLRGTMRKMSLSFGLMPPVTRTYPEPLVHSILRSEFDYFLLERARQAGVEFFQGVRTLGYTADRRRPVTVHSDSGDLECRMLVGADGANSVVGRSLNARDQFFWQAAIYCEIPESALDRDGLDPECMRVDWGSLPSGYAWIFPKHGYVNVGAGGPTKIARMLRPYLTRFVDSVGIMKPGSSANLKFTGHQLPTLTRATRLASERVLLVGDAAGLVEPFTGDGISFACHSARLAAECIARAFAGGNLDLSEYQRILRSQVGPELFWSRKLVTLSVAFPKLVYRLFQHKDSVWQTFCKILRGEESFQKLTKEILGPLEFAWNAVDTITQFRERKLLGESASPASI
jgi:geranylgeranyl reductase family protein